MMKDERKKGRVREVAAVFVRHGVKKGLKNSVDPANIRLAFEELGPTYVKIGQMLSLRPDMIPPAYQKEFQKLQDNVGPEPFADIRAVVEESLKKPLAELFSAFDETAMASASLAEVHRARLLNGEEVVVKIQRPGVKARLLDDLAILRSLCRLYEMVPVFHFINVKDTLDELEKNAVLELDFLNEAKNIALFYDNHQDVRCITSPKIYPAYTTEKVLVMQYIEGIKINDLAAIDEAGYDRQDIGEKLANNYLKQIFEDGFFHADPHPGNLMIIGNQIAYVDFGLMGSLDQTLLKELNDFLKGIASGDIDGMTRAILRIGTQKGAVDTEKLYDDVAALYTKYVDAAFDDLNISAVVNEIFHVCTRNHIVIPREVTLLGKGLLTLESVLAEVSPKISTIKIALNYGARHFMADRDLKQELTELSKTLYQFSLSGLKLPDKLTRFLDTAQAGRLTVKMENPKQEKQLEIVNRMVNRVVLGLVISALIIASSMIVGANVGAKFRGIMFLGVAGYVAAAVLGLWLIIAIIKSNKL